MFWSRTGRLSPAIAWCTSVVRVGTLALMQGGAAISKDLPPFCVARGDNGICGLNSVGLRRAGFEAGERLG